MKIAIIADVHSNLVAFESVIAAVEAWGPDQVFVAGDVVNRGPRPAECLKLVQEKVRTQGWLVVRGNHEDYVISQARPEAPCSGPRYETHRASRWTYDRLGEDVSGLLEMPFAQRLSGPDRSEVRLVHASMLGNRSGIYPEMDDAEISRRVGEDPPAVLCVGHTHRPLIRQLPGTLVVNAGSAGLPFDGDTCPSYARLVFSRGQWQAEIVRVEYDLDRAVQDFYATGYAEEAGPLTDLVLVELRTASSQLGGWSARFQKQAELGEITMRESVDRFLRKDY